MLNSFREALPPNCPPDDAEEVTEPLVMYRLIKGDEPSCEDFDSLYKKNPDAAKLSGDLCAAAGLSVFRTVEAVANTNKFQKGGFSIYALHLRSGVGILKSTFKDPDHFTLWPYRDFDLMKILEKVR